ncbi:MULTISPECIES: hypothetical protein [unclassified Bradyrhizobium]|uniref:hypothetical protein n=1 Tax=unclassified Bradyrhizobium TaxID=2631580 RepID=UPI0020B1B0ED|nr:MULTISPECIES: hypothetical protein [unclassified Bradyrhizobium]MCP3385706.1 hypothetical protein [Bradyrhizobium sp. CCGUVB4N]MCP3446974.1 hypothetical protein [Bradyrhizobium sp. CCGUVB14]WFU82823.1 hypothetical protein QA645_08830 [Bradyrhizobium sp. CIAT3101]
MTSISTDGPVDSQAQSSLQRKGSDQAFTLTFLVTSAVATVGWLYVLAQGAVAVAGWFFSQ